MEVPFTTYLHGWQESVRPRSAVRVSGQPQKNVPKNVWSKICQEKEALSARGQGKEKKECEHRLEKRHRRSEVYGGLKKPGGTCSMDWKGYHLTGVGVHASGSGKLICCKAGEWARGPDKEVRAGRSGTADT